MMARPGLRLREDIAKYLYEGAGHYDGKSRSMRLDPSAGSGLVRADNWERYGGDAKQLLKQEQAAWHNVEKLGGQLNTVAFPTGTELFYRKL